MSSYLSGTATYEPGGDLVAVEFAVYEEIAPVPPATRKTYDPVPPRTIASASVALIKGGKYTLAEVTDLTKFHANEDFLWRVYFNHPPSIDLLTVDLTVEARDGTEWTKTLSVLRARREPAEGDFVDNSASRLRT